MRGAAEGHGRGRSFRRQLGGREHRGDLHRAEARRRILARKRVIESRVPLLDTRIVDLVTSMPPGIKFRGGRTKHAFRCAVAKDTVVIHGDLDDTVPLSDSLAWAAVREAAWLLHQ